MSVLAEIVASVRERLQETKRVRPEARVREEAEAAAPRASFAAALDAAGTTLIAETKRRSPSRGTLRESYDAAALARMYESAGARAISVLTEPAFFGGSLEDLAAVRAATRAPLLRKDFVVDPYQVLEARAAGASALLLIVAALDDAELADLRALAGEYSLDALVEVHTDREAERAVAAGASIVGVNNRDLATFRTDRATTARIARALPRGVRVVAESGIATRADVLEMEAAGACAVLVGEAIVTAADPAGKVRELIGADTA